jgi:hypothetical protein
MAQRTQVLLIDDIDGGKAEETLTFALDGVTYEIDLNEGHARELRDSLGRWLASGRRVSGRAQRGRGRPAGDAGMTARVRQWAKQSGLGVSERGRISAEVRAAYDAAH